MKIKASLDVNLKEKEVRQLVEKALKQSIKDVIS